MPTLDYADAYARDYRPYKGGAWCYEDGCLYRALVLLHRSTGERRWLDHLVRLAGRQVGVDGTLAGYDPGEYNIDNILSGRCLFHLSDQTGDGRYMRAAAQLASQLRSHPRTARGNYWHKAIYPHQVWLDGLYMGLPFQIEYGRRTGDAALVKDALVQFETALAVLARPDGLYAHGYDESGTQTWADRRTGQNRDLWARSLGWLAMALADAADLLPAGEDRRRVGAPLADLLTRIAGLATAHGLWLQVPDRPDLPANYEETSASAMFAYAALVAHRLGVFEPGRDLGIRVLDVLQRSALRTAPDGRLVLDRICTVAGLGGSGPPRDGTAAYYLSEPVSSDDPKGVGPFLMATAERVRQTDVSPV